MGGCNLARKRRMHLILRRENKAKLIRPTAARQRQNTASAPEKPIATVTYGGIVSHVARMERSAIRDKRTCGITPDFASLHPGYASFPRYSAHNQSGRFISNMASGRISK